MKHSPTGTSASPPAPEMFILHGINLGLFGKLLKNHLDMTLMDAPVSYRTSTAMLLNLILYMIALSRLTSSTVTCLMQPSN